MVKSKHVTQWDTSIRAKMIVKSCLFVHGFLSEKAVKLVSSRGGVMTHETHDVYMMTSRINGAAE